MAAAGLANFIGFVTLVGVHNAGATGTRLGGCASTMAASVRRQTGQTYNNRQTYPYCKSFHPTTSFPTCILVLMLSP
jgi:hypothetical protein